MSKITLEFSIEDLLNIYDPNNDGSINRVKICDALKSGSKETLTAVVNDIVIAMTQACEEGILGDPSEVAEAVFGCECLNDEDCDED